MNRQKKGIWIVGISIGVTALGFCLQPLGGVWSIWDYEYDRPGGMLVPLFFLLTGACIRVMAIDKKGKFDTSLGCAYGTFVLMGILALLAYAYVADIGSWAA